MKRITTSIWAAALAVSLSGCSGFLDENLKSELAPDNTYTSTYGFEIGAAGLYSWARAEFSTWNSDDDAAFTHSQACPYESLQVATDLVYTAHKDGSLLPFENLSYTASSTYVESYWNWAYGLIANANLLIQYSEGDVDWDAKTDKAFYQATARFFRAYAYRYLIYLYGDVPYVDKIEENFRIDFTRTPKEEVLQHMIDDLTFAAENLPEDPDAETVNSYLFTEPFVTRLDNENGSDFLYSFLTVFNAASYNSPCFNPLSAEIDFWLSKYFEYVSANIFAESELLNPYSKLAEQIRRVTTPYSK